MKLTKKIIFYLALVFAYLLIIELTSRIIVSYKTKSLDIFSFGFSKEVKFEILDLSEFKFIVSGKDKIYKKNKILKKRNKKNDKTTTIWTYGASLTEGYNCGIKSSSWADELIKINNKINIVNFAVPGIYSDFSIKKLEYSLTNNISKKPDIIIWAHRDEEILSFFNGLQRNAKKNLSKYSSTQINSVSYFLLRLDKTAKNNLTFFKIMDHGFNKINNTTSKKRKENNPTNSDIKIAIENFKLNTLDAINISEDYDIKIFLILSLFTRDEAKYDKTVNQKLLNNYFETTKSIQETRKIDFLNTVKKLTDAERKNAFDYFCESGHFNLKGNKLIAEIINNHITKK